MLHFLIHKKEKFEPGYYKFNTALYFPVDFRHLDNRYNKHEVFVKSKVDSVIVSVERRREIRGEISTMNQRKTELSKELEQLETQDESSE